MKIRIRDRLFVTLAGLVLIAASAALVAQAFFGVDIAGLGAAFVARRDLKHLAITIAAAAILLLLGVYCFLMLFRRARRNGGFVVQKTDTGELSISMKALEALVQKCVDKHDELHVVATSLENTRDGLIIRLRIGLASGVNIPLVVNTLQKQIKQYVTSCSGVDVREVRVQVVTSPSKMKDSAYTVADVEPTAPVKEEVPEAAPAPAVEEKKRPLHQRLFGRADQPNEVPVPPMPAEAEKPAEPDEAPAEAAAEEAPAAPVTEEAPAEEAAAETAPEAETPAEEETPDDAQPQEEPKKPYLSLDIEEALLEVNDNEQ